MFWATNADFFLLIQSVTSSAYVTILGAFLIGFGTGEMLVSNCVLKRSGFIAIINSVGLIGSPCLTPFLIKRGQSVLSLPEFWMCYIVVLNLYNW